MRTWIMWLGVGLTGLVCGAGFAQEQDERRAGRPFDVAPWARPSDTGSYLGHLVGGGRVGLRGDAPTRDEGTWGWDYSGWLLHRRVDLGWWHGRRYQGGSGAYRSDGPRVLPELHEEGR